jgi:hypothetical protein
MKIDDPDFEEILALLPKENIPSDPVEARQAVENFVDLVELLMRPLLLPPADSSMPRQLPLDRREAFSTPLSTTGVT